LNKPFWQDNVKVLLLMAVVVLGIATASLAIIRPAPEVKVLRTTELIYITRWQTFTTTTTETAFMTRTVTEYPPRPAHFRLTVAGVLYCYCIEHYLLIRDLHGNILYREVWRPYRAVTTFLPAFRHYSVAIYNNWGGAGRPCWGPVLVYLDADMFISVP
jgi:hypothetical protein